MICSERERGTRFAEGRPISLARLVRGGPISLANTARGANLASEIGPGGPISRGTDFAVTPALILAHLVRTQHTNTSLTRIIHGQYLTRNADVFQNLVRCSVIVSMQ